MKCLITLVIAFCLATPAMAGEEPYIAVVGNDAAADGFYNSSKYKQFMYDQTQFGEPPVCIGSFPDAYNEPLKPTYGAGCEQFHPQTAVDQPEVCDPSGARIHTNAKIGSGHAGTFEWYVRLTREPSSEINFVLQCGVLKPGGSQFLLRG